MRHVIPLYVAFIHQFMPEFQFFVNRSIQVSQTEKRAEPARNIVGLKVFLIRKFAGKKKGMH